MRASFIFSEVLTGLRRNITMTIAMILTTAISLGLFGGGLLVVQMAGKTQQIFLDRVEVQIFLTDDISASDADCAQETCATLRSDLENTPSVVSVQYLNREDAVKDATERVFKDQPELAELVSADSFPASFKVRLSDPERFGVINDNFENRPGVQSVLNQRDLVERLFSVLNGVRNAAFAIATVQAIAAILLIANMVQIAAFTRRTEVGIMRLVGATRWYTQLPFLLEAVVAALIGSALAIAGLFTAKNMFIDDVLSDVYQANILARISNSDVLLVSPFLALVGVGMAAVTAYITLRLYVRE
ncbi:cell division protein FtsX [Rhodococcus sp. 06-418-5]|jgi:cell division transport system permease protein|uniref:permease-like cell division protein FtsX n=1 Tax=unclassified Rhodococcus (in: high G+C Gram-positive bacteria) TaxID=192944 RepID=UPI000B9C65F0|nr:MULTISPECIES: permease-like cell division protein FtsX [unclassified Rhodococcus (in: high G+C Gram-positive bacteria)]OZC69009.1 cell division protein FtsX [Rhodococcus sp. 06-470-2]OZC82640.1 cell division protein FtsX [Rhodococcus sp. 06-418-5]OZE06194.1 cell division protein FtsX [Rhodococcus sp. 05-2255-3B1]OZE07397.1 cell division protein FtsX [Rhodococcus sp. 05-2255-3C]OZE18346.1 cell division protein FtsX [Rhodococcus sp. 05-2255-2A2]